VKTTVRLLLVPVMMSVMGGWGLCAPSRSSGAAPGARSQAVNIAALKGAQRLDLLGKSVAVEGYYNDESAPILLRSPSLASTNTLLPPDSFVMLKAKLPRSVKCGDRVRVSAVVRQPSGSDPAWTQGQTVVLSEAAQPSVIGHASLPPLSSAPDPATLAGAPIGEMRAPTRPTPRKYAVLIWSGTSAHAVWWGRHQRELNEVYRALLSRGYSQSGIFVLCGPPSAYSEYTGSRRACTRTALSVMFDQLAGLMTDEKYLFIYLTGAGGGFYAHQMGVEDPTGVYEGVLDANGDETHEATYESAYHLDLNGDGDTGDQVAFDETIGLADGRITDDEFAAEVAKIGHYGRITAVMQQSFAGGFAEDLAGPRRVLLAACTEKQFAWVRGPGSAMSEFTSNLVGAITNPASLGVHSGQTYCWGSLYNAARSRDRRWPLETPCYDDDGAFPFRVGNLPYGQEGLLGMQSPM